MNTCTAGLDDLFTNERIERLVSFNRYLAHDIRAPLLASIGAADLAHAALAQGDVEKALRLLGLLSARAHSMFGLVSALMALASAADDKLDLAPLSLTELARDAMEDACLSAGLVSPPTIVLHPLPNAVGSAPLLRQVFVNLVGNAMKFSRAAAAPVVEIGVARAEQALAVLFVRDNGVGFPAQDAGRLFEPFSRLHGSGYAGHGIGLNIVRRIVERHGGRVWAEPTSPRGATFYFTIPTISNFDPLASSRDDRGPTHL